MHRTITATYPGRDPAEQVRRQLVEAGIARERIHLVERKGADEDDTVFPHGAQRGGHEHPLHHANQFEAPEAAHDSAAHAHRGGDTVHGDGDIVLSVEANDETVERARDILQSSHPLDMGEHSSPFRGAGLVPHGSGK